MLNFLKFFFWEDVEHTFDGINYFSETRAEFCAPFAWIFTLPLAIWEFNQLKKLSSKK